MTTYVAMGDSFTAGLDPGQPRWPDEIARALGPDVLYENLAVVGATSEKVESEQLARAIELDPDLVTLVCGANDVLESTRPDSREYAERLARMFQRLRRRRPTPRSCPPPIRTSRVSSTCARARARGWSRACGCSTRPHGRSPMRHGVVLLEGFDHPAAQDRATFADDGFHPSDEGHRRAASSSCVVEGPRQRALPASAEEGPSSA